MNQERKTIRVNAATDRVDALTARQQRIESALSDANAAAERHTADLATTAADLERAQQHLDWITAAPVDASE